MPLHADAQAVVDLLLGLGVGAPETLEPAAARALFATLAIPSSVEVARIDDRSCPGPAGAIPIRVYDPDPGRALPAVVYFHGGGFVLGGLESHDQLCRLLADAAGAVVVAVDYRLAPEDPFPAALDDAWAATRWVHDHASELGADPGRLAVAGDSAGGNLAAVVAVRARDEGGPVLRAQLLAYPVTSQRTDWPSNVEHGTGCFLTTASMEWFRANYLPDEATWDDPRAAPIETPDLAGLPPATIVVAECDPLRSQDEAYAEKLRAAGNDVAVVFADGMFHGFYGMHPFVPSATPPWDASVARLRSALGG